MILQEGVSVGWQSGDRPLNGLSAKGGESLGVFSII